MRYNYYSSTNDNPNHARYSIGSDSRCSWQQASANAEFASFKNDYQALPKNILNSIKPIYEYLSKDALLKKNVQAAVFKITMRATTTSPRNHSEWLNHHRITCKHHCLYESMLPYKSPINVSAKTSVNLQLTKTRTSLRSPRRERQENIPRGENA